MSINTESVRKSLAEIRHPLAERSLVDLNMFPHLEVDGDKVSLTLELLTPAGAYRQSFSDEIKQKLKALGAQVELEVTHRQRSSQPALGGGPLKTVKNVVAVASGKGGVGKSTVATNLAAALAHDGAAVGLLDADIYGPSVPALLGVDSSQVKVLNKRIQPVEKYGLRIMSMGLLMKPGESVIWRGPMLHGMMQQFCRDVDWGELDFLVIDLPPGTGDVSLSLSQLAPIGGAVVVSTPQDVALGVATKAINMFGKLNVPILGMVENMSFYCCPNCDHRDDLFGSGGARRAAAQFNTPFLGEIPLNSAIRKAGDAGQPVVLAEPESAPAQALFAIARQAAERISLAGEVGLENLVAT